MMPVLIQGDSQRFISVTTLESLCRNGEGIEYVQGTEVQRIYKVAGREGYEPCYILVENYHREAMDVLRYEQGKRGRK
jgi:hypothetical protein